MASNEQAKGCSAILIMFFGFSFLLITLFSVIGFLFGGDSFITDFMNSDSDGASLSKLRFSFWLTLISLIIYLITGGKIKDIFKYNK